MALIVEQKTCVRRFYVNLGLDVWGSVQQLHTIRKGSTRSSSVFSLSPSVVLLLRTLVIVNFSHFIFTIQFNDVIRNARQFWAIV